jgi:quercetin 2,3-dioxygenase
MKTILHKADTRGGANHGWLNTKHTFSFANYYDPSRMNFGVLRVLNDDIVAPSMGFGTHPHDNMEIISIPLCGDLEHKDSMGNTQVICENDVQILSAGTGIQHSEKNKNHDQEVAFLQIWIFPKERNIKPNYDQKTFSAEEKQNHLLQIVSPPYDEKGININQDVWFSIGKLDAGFEENYTLRKKGNGVYAFVLEGNVSIDNQELSRRDGLGIWETDSINIKANGSAELLLMEVPMT